MSIGTHEMDWLTNAIMIGAGVVGAVLLLLILAALLDCFAQDLAGAQAVRAVTRKPVVRTYCPLCLFETALTLPTDRWAPWLFAGEAVPCAAHAGEYYAMSGALWSPQTWTDTHEPMTNDETDADDAVSAMDTAELPEVKAS